MEEIDREKKEREKNRSRVKKPNKRPEGREQTYYKPQLQHGNVDARRDREKTSETRNRSTFPFYGPPGNFAKWVFSVLLTRCTESCLLRPSAKAE